MEVIMGLATRMVCLVLLIGISGAAGGQGDDSRTGGLWGGNRSREGVPVRRVAFQRAGGPARFSVRWIGQDGQDFVSPNNRLEPSEVQDIHLALGGLDPGREVAFIDVLPPGGDQWHYNAQSFAWKAELKRRKGASTADLYLEPGRVETGRIFHVTLRYEDGSTVEANVRSRKTDPYLRMPGAAVRAQWVGQDRYDRVGPGLAVGPDGISDARIRLSGLGVKVPIRSIRLDSPSGGHWEFGSNPQLQSYAELVRDAKDPSQGDLYFQPERDVAGQRLRITVSYANEKRDATTVAGGRFAPTLRMPESPLPKIEERPLTARWLGQDGDARARMGDVHVILSGLSGRSRLGAVVLTGSVRGFWVHRASDRVGPPADPMEAPLEVRIRPDGTAVDLFFAPCRDSRDETFSVRLIRTDGRMTYARFPGGPCELARRAPSPAATRVDARPGDDLQALVDRYGTVVLAPGTYRLVHPLVLNRPVTLTSSGKATLLFAQDRSDPPWTTAIKVRCSNTTLDGFAVRFDGPVRWNREVSYGPAIVGMTDNFDAGYDELKVNLVFTGLDLEHPSIGDATGFFEAVRLMRMVHAQSGVIARNVLRGGTIEVFDGPWQIVDNEYRGTPPGTVSMGFFAGHNVHDVVVRGNRLSSPEPSGKTWRFLILTGSGASDRVERNLIEGIGSREGDTIEWMNAPEIILTEGYSVKYEGNVLATSADRRVIRIGHPQVDMVRTGDVVSILSGSGAGSWRRVSQAIDAATFLVDEPIPSGTVAVSVSPGFVNEVFEANTIDVRGGRRSDGFVLAGNHFGTRVANNRLMGGSLGFRMMASPTEHPVTWGWSHAPCLGGVIEGNILEDCEQGGLVGLEHSEYIKPNVGRTYMNVALRKNVVRWSDPFLARMARSDSRKPVPGLTLGYQPAKDPGELVVTAEGNTLEAPRGYRDAPALIVHAAIYNSRRIVERRFKLPSDRSSAPGQRTSGNNDASRR
jgi:hypothetical protein